MPRKKVKTTYEGKEIEVDVDLPEQAQPPVQDTPATTTLPPSPVGGVDDRSSLEKMMQLISEQAKEIQALKGIINEVANEKNAVQKEIQTYIENQKAKEVTTLLDSAVKDGRITPESRSKWEQRLKENYDQFSDTLQELPKAKALQQDAKPIGTVVNPTGGTQGNNPAGALRVDMSQVRNAIASQMEVN